MTKGIYCYIDNITNIIVYIGKDSNIHNNVRHQHHISPSNYYKQLINYNLQNNPSRYKYKILKIVDTTKELQQWEQILIGRFNPQFNILDGSVNEFQQLQPRSFKNRKNQTGIKYLHKKRRNEIKQGFVWRYMMNGKGIDIQSTNLLNVEKKVKKQNLPWIIINEKLAQQMYKENQQNINGEK